MISDFGQISSFMQTLGTNQLLSSIVEITEQRDCVRFRESMCKTVREMAPIVGIAFVRPIERISLDASTTAKNYEILYQDPPVDIYNAGFWGSLDDPQGALNPVHVLEMMYSGHSLVMSQQRATLLLPIMNRDILAEIVVVRAETISQNSVFLLQTFARLYRNFLSLISETEQDPLTGLYNRRVLETRLTAVLRTAEQRHRLLRPKNVEAGSSPAPLRPYLAVFDIDKFKRINDTLGHLFGDEIILLVSNLMKEVFRGHDTLFRYGGDEFVVILMAENRAGAKAALERFRERVAEHSFPQLDQITTSIGFVEIRGGEQPASVIGKADQALYQAKTEGRNRVCDYDEVLAHGDAHVPVEHTDAEMF